MHEPEAPQQDGAQRLEAAFGERVKRLRLTRGISQKVLADQLGVDASAVSRIEQGSRAVRLGEAAVIAAALGRTVDELISDPDPLATRESLIMSVIDRRMVGRGALGGAATYLVALYNLLEDSPELLADMRFGRLKRSPKNASDYLRQLAKQSETQQSVVRLGADVDTRELVKDILVADAKSIISSMEAD